MQRFFLTVFTLIAIAVTIWVIGQRPKNLSAEPPPASSLQTDNPTQNPPETESALEKAVVTKDEDPVAEEPKNTRPADGGMSEAEFLRLYNATDFARSMPTAQLVEKLEAQNPETIASYMQNMLDTIGSKDMNERGRLLFLANELRSPELIPFWSHVLERNPKALENEAQLFQAKEPNVETMALRSELSAAVRNLGLLAFKDDSALNTLIAYAKKPDPNFDNKYFRKEAYYAIKEVNVTAAVRVVQSLPKDDALREVLSHD